MRIRRFDAIERVAHWATAFLVFVLFATGIILYVPSLSVAVGRRLLIEDLHVYVGVAVFVPIAVSASGSWGAALRSDLRSVNRFTKHELAWLRTAGRLGKDRIGKFNPGQKLNTVAIGALLTVLLFTGLILRWGNFLPVAWRTGATFTHDWFALAIVILVAGHVVFALSHPAALRSMFRGWVTEAWATHHAPAWRPTDADYVRAAPGSIEGDTEATPDAAAATR